jgi:signal transduction histidine kinase
MGNTHTDAPVPIHDARGATDDRLASERKQADCVLDRKLATHEQRADEKIEHARETADQSLAQASAEATAEVGAVDPEAEPVVQAVSEQAEQALAAERAENPRVLCDRHRIIQVLGNLLGNATKFTPPGGRIVIRCDPMDEDVQFSVSDTGPGIADIEHGQIFQRRWHTDVRRGGGVGLGLYISKHIVDSHGGRVWVESTEGQGSTFYFTLPAQTG